MAVVKRIGVLSLAKVYASILAVVGLAQGIGYAIMYAVNPNAVPQMMDLGFNVGYAAILVMPILSALSGFISGVVFAWLYNFFAAKMGGVQLDMEVVVSNSVEKKKK